MSVWSSSIASLVYMAFLVMIFYQPLDGALTDWAEGKVEVCGSLADAALKKVGYGAYEPDGQVGAAVVGHVALEEGGKGLYRHLPYGRVAELAMHKRCQRSEPAVGEGLAVDAVDDVGGGDTRLFKEPVGNLAGHLSLEDVAYQQLAQIGAAALVAEDVAQWRGVGNYLLAVVEAGVAAGAQNAGHALAALAQGAGGSQHVGVDLHVAVQAEDGPQRHSYALAPVARRAACAVEPQLADALAGNLLER